MPSKLVWKYLKLKWTLGVLLFGLVAVGGLFGDGPLRLVVVAFVVVAVTLGYGFARVTFQS